MLVNHHKCCFGKSTIYYVVVILPQKSAQLCTLRLFGYYNYISWKFAPCPSTLCTLLGKLKRLTRTSCECSRSFGREVGVILFIGVRELFFDLFWRSMGQALLCEAKRTHRHKSSI